MSEIHMTQADKILSDIYDLRQREASNWEKEELIQKEWNEIFTRVAVYLGIRDRNTWVLHRAARGEFDGKKGPK